MGATHLRPSFGGVFKKTPYGAPEPRKALGERPEGVAHRDVRDWPTRQDASLGQRRDPKPRRRGEVRHPGRAFFGFLYNTTYTVFDIHGFANRQTDLVGIVQIERKQGHRFAFWGPQLGWLLERSSSDCRKSERVPPGDQDDTPHRD